MRLRLVALRATGDGSCLAEFERDSREEPVVARFTVLDRDGVTTAMPHPDVFGDFDGTADDVRGIVAAVIAFWSVSEKREVG